MAFFTSLWLLIIATNGVWTAKVEPRVYGGQYLRTDRHKYLVKLEMYIPELQVTYECSGSILSQRWIITSGHCIKKKCDFIKIKKKIGDELKMLAKVLKTDVTVHPKYMFNPRFEYDLALMKTVANIEFDDLVQNIGLPKGNYAAIGKCGIIAGYGTAEPGASQPREGSVLIEICSKQSRFRRTLKIICTNSVVAAGNGDSGGALTRNGKLVGVTSASCEYEDHKLCESIYTDVRKHLDWIKNVTQL